LEKWQIFSSC
jgi:hypothetical protein